MNKLQDGDFIPSFLHHRPSDKPLDHIATARATYAEQIAHTSGALKIIDLRMEETQEAIARLRRQQADDQREVDSLQRALKAARRAMAELDGVEL